MALTNNVLLDLLPQRLAILDTIGNIITVNKAWEDFAKIHPLSIESLVTNTSYLTACSKVSSPNNQYTLHFVQGITSVIKGERESFEMEYGYHTSNEEFWFLATAKRTNNTDSAVVVIVHTDISKQKIAEKKANREINYSFQVLELSGDAVIVINKKQEICFFNNNSEKIFGYSKKETLGKPFNILILGKFHSVFNKYVEQFISSPKPFQYSDNRQGLIGLRKDRSEFLADIAISKLFSHQELFLTLVVRDISEQKITNNQLQEQTTILSSISESMATFLQAHDLKKSLQPILQTISKVTKSQFAALGFFPDNLKLQVITNTNEMIEVETNRAMFKEIEDDVRDFEDISLERQLFYLISKTLSTSLTQIKSAEIKNLNLSYTSEILKLRNFISMPIKCQNAITSVLVLANSSFAYEQENIKLLEPAIEVLGIIYDSYQHIQQKTKLENQQKLTQQELLTRARQQSLLVRLGRQALLEVDVSKLMEYFINAIKEVLTIDCCFILEFDKDNTLCLRPESFGLIKNSSSSDSTSLSVASVNSNSLVNMLLGSTGPLIIDDIETDLRFNIPIFFKLQNFTSGISVVLYIDNEVFGFLGAFTRTKRLFTSNEANFLQTIAHTLVTAIKRKQDEDRLGEHLKLIDASNDAIIACDLKQKIVFWSRGASSLYGIDRERALGASIAELITNQDFGLINNIIDTVLSSNEWVGEITSQDINGNDMVILSHWTLIYDNFKNPKTFLLVNTNITEKKKLETQFLRTQRMENLGSLASGIAHDLNNLLTPIMLSLDLLKKRADERSMRLIERVESSTKRGSEMVKQILSFAKGIETNQTTINLQNVLDELLNMIKVSFPQSIRVYSNYSPKTWLVLANATQIFQVLMNLCVNAREAMPEGGILTITVKNELLDDLEEFNELKEATPFVQISISDTGVGINTEHVKKIFEPFFTTKGANGTGLGLAMVASIIEKHKGFIRVNSQLNKGTTFSIYLPAISDEETKQSFTKKNESLVGNNQSILLIDSEISTLEISKTTLEAYNYRVLPASNGADAVAIFFDNHQHVDAVIIDMFVVELDSAIVISSLKKANPRVKIIVTSNDLSVYTKLDTLSVTVKKLTKPYTAEAILKSLKEILSE
ncbi:MAG: PAS domain S-box protein [Acidobacteria bacterium]|nr:PAS domain S-box protein [Acidobacteriota bacterium]